MPTAQPTRTISTKDILLASVLQAGGAVIVSTRREGAFFRIVLDLCQFDAQRLAEGFEHLACVLRGLTPASPPADFERLANTTILPALDRLAQDTKRRGAEESPGRRT